MPNEPDKKTVLDRLIGSLKWGTIGTGVGAAAGVGLGAIARKGHFGKSFSEYASRKFPLFPDPAVTHAIAGAGVGSKVGALAGLVAGRKKKDVKELSSMLDDLIEFGITSISTAKKVFRSVREAHPGLKVIRPYGTSVDARYVPKGMSKAGTSYLEDRHGIGAWGGLEKGVIKPHTIVVPRVSKDMMKSWKEGIAEGLAAGTPKTLAIRTRAIRRHEAVVLDPLAAALHEHGHPSMPNVSRRAINKSVNVALKEPAGMKFTDPHWGTMIEEEYRANRKVRDLIEKHGTQPEVKAWEGQAKKQIRHGYQTPFFNAALQESITPKVKKQIEGMSFPHAPLSLSRKAMAKIPWIKRQELASKLSDLIEFKCATRNHPVAQPDL